MHSLKKRTLYLQSYTCKYKKPLNINLFASLYSLDFDFSSSIRTYAIYKKESEWRQKKAEIAIILACPPSLFHSLHKKSKVNNQSWIEKDKKRRRAETYQQQSANNISISFSSFLSFLEEEKAKGGISLKFASSSWAFFLFSAFCLLGEEDEDFFLGECGFVGSKLGRV